jgi:hypothetical protein
VISGSAYLFTTGLGAFRLLLSLRSLASNTLAGLNKYSGRTVEIIQECTFLKSVTANIVAVWFLEYLQSQRTFQVDCHSGHLNLVVIVVRVIGCVISSSAKSSRLLGIVFGKPCTGVWNRGSVFAPVDGIMYCTLEVLVFVMIAVSCLDVSITIKLYNKNTPTCLSCSSRCISLHALPWPSSKALPH